MIQAIGNRQNFNVNYFVAPNNDFTQLMLIRVFQTLDCLTQGSAKIDFYCYSYGYPTDT